MKRPPAARCLGVRKLPDLSVASVRLPRPVSGQSTPDRERALAEVDIGPGKAEQLTLPKSGGRRESEERTERMSLAGGQERP